MEEKAYFVLLFLFFLLLLFLFFYSLFVFFYFILTFFSLKSIFITKALKELLNNRDWRLETKLVRLEVHQMLGGEVRL